MCNQTYNLKQQLNLTTLALIIFHCCLLCCIGFFNGESSFMADCFVRLHTQLHSTNRLQCVGSKGASEIRPYLSDIGEHSFTRCIAVWNQQYTLCQQMGTIYHSIMSLAYLVKPSRLYTYQTAELSILRRELNGLKCAFKNTRDVLICWYIEMSIATWQPFQSKLPQQ